VSRRRARRRLPTPSELVIAPELAILGALDAALDLAIIALVAAQPELHATEHGRDVVRSQAAHNADLVIARAQALAAAIVVYRITRDLPF
jgi:hypothetical protein